MTRFTLLQFRSQALVGLGTVVVLAVMLAVTGPHLAHLYAVNIATCVARGDCQTATSAFLQDDHGLQVAVDALVVVVPGVIGLFWGAPLVARELESGTYRLAWSQSVTRARWLAVKVGVIGGASLAVAGLLSLMVTWWSRSMDRADMDIFKTFDQRDVVPIGYAAFAFALGVTAGVVARRSVPAMAATLAGFIFARVAVVNWVRPNLLAPFHRYLRLTLGTVGYGSTNSGPASLQVNPTSMPNAWVYSTEIANRSGQVLSPGYVARACPSLNVGPQKGGGGGGLGPVPVQGGGGAGHAARQQASAQAQAVLRACIEKVGATYHAVVTYQPASHYWTLQWYELSVYVAAAAILLGFCTWWARRRLS